MGRCLFLGVFVCCLGFGVGAEEIRVLSYNVRHGTGMDGGDTLEQQAKVIASAKAHLVGLQEIDEKCGRSGSVDQAAKFAERTGTTGHFGSFMDFGGGRYGMAMLSKLQVINSKVLRLPAGREPRVAIILEVETPEKNRLLVANVHFDWTSEALRGPQAKTLIDYLDTIPLAAIVLGDYNAKPDSDTLKQFKAAGFRFLEKPSDNRLTWNARKPTVEIDHVAVRDGKRLALKGGACTVLPEAEASDHRPISAVIQLNPIK